MPLGPVKNQFPSVASPYRVALVGEAPGVDELRLGYPFAGSSGHLLNAVLSSVGLERAACFVGNVAQFKPSATSNDFWRLDWRGAEVQAGIAALLNDLATFAPNVVVALGNVPLHLFKHGNLAPVRSKAGPYNWPSKISVWRGSLFLAHELCTPHLWVDTSDLETARLFDVSPNGK